MDHENQSDQLASVWAHEHQDLLSRCFECFQSTARWPTLDQLQLDLAVNGQEMDVEDLAYSMPSLLGVVDQERLGLNVRGMSEVPAALPLLEIWVSLLRSACEKGFDRSITSEEVWAACAGDPTRAACITSILFRETWPPHRGEGISGGRWWVNVDDSVIDIREARTVADVLKVRGPVQSKARPTLMEGLESLSEFLDEQ